MKMNERMPFSVSDEEMDRIKADCIRRIREESAGSRSVIFLHRRIIEYAAAAVLIVGIAVGTYAGMEKRPSMDRFISQLNEAPSDVIDEMCSDVSDYNEDYSNML